MTSVEQLRQLIVGILKIMKTILPQAHILKAGMHLLIRCNPIGRTEGHHHHEKAQEANHSAKHYAICNL